MPSGPLFSSRAWAPAPPSPPPRPWVPTFYCSPGPSPRFLEGPSVLSLPYLLLRLPNPSTSVPVSLHLCPGLYPVSHLLPLLLILCPQSSLPSSPFPSCLSLPFLFFPPNPFVSPPALSLRGYPRLPPPGSSLRPGTFPTPRPPPGPGAPPAGLPASVSFPSRLLPLPAALLRGRMCARPEKAAAGREESSSAPQASGHSHATPGARPGLVARATGEAGAEHPNSGATGAALTLGLASDLSSAARFGAWTSSSAVGSRPFLPLPGPLIILIRVPRHRSGDSGRPTRHSELGTGWGC